MGDADESENDAEKKSIYEEEGDATEDEYADSGNEGNSDDDVDGEVDDEETQEEIAKFAAQVRARNKKNAARSNKQTGKVGCWSIDIGDC